MAAPTETYIDPDIAADSGAGTIGDPFGDVQYALDQVTRDATDGDRMNILTGTDEILAAALDFSTYGTPTAAAPIIFQGYTSAAGDGGIGGISGNGSYAVVDSTTLDNIWFIDMHLHNCGAGYIFRGDNDCVAINCEIDNTTGAGLEGDARFLVVNCNIHNIDGNGIRGQGLIAFNRLANGTNDFNTGIVGEAGAEILGNIIDIDGASNGILLTSPRISLSNNTVFSIAGTGYGIQIANVDNMQSVILNNYVEGFSGVGGVGYTDGGYETLIYGHNYAYNNTTNFSITGHVFLNLGNNTVLGSSALSNPGADDFTVDTSVRALAYPTANYPSLAVRTYLDIGALQREEAAAGGGLLKHPGMAGGMDA